MTTAMVICIGLARFDYDAHFKMGAQALQWRLDCIAVAHVTRFIARHVPCWDNRRE